MNSRKNRFMKIPPLTKLEQIVRARVKFFESIPKLAYPTNGTSPTAVTQLPVHRVRLIFLFYILLNLVFKNPKIQILNVT